MTKSIKLNSFFLFVKMRYDEYSIICKEFI